MPGRSLRIATYPAPVGGLNTADPVDRMPLDCAPLMINLFPGTSLYGRSAAYVRGGTILHCDTGDATPAYTLMSYSGGGTEQLLSAHESGAIYDVTTATPATLATGYNTGTWSWANFANAAGNYIIACNSTGLDSAWVYDGATITALVVAGVAVADLALVCVYLQRPFYVERDSLSLWYPVAGAYQGALTELDLSSYATKGGTISNLSTWTRDNGAGGMDDLLVVVTTRGQALIYQGIDPGVATLWNLIGVFDIGDPVAGPNSIIRTGPDLMLLSSDGFRLMSDYLALGRSQGTENALSRNISGRAKLTAALGAIVSDWTGIMYAAQSMLIVSCRIGVSSGAYIFVANTTTGKWCEYSGIDAYSWGVSGGDLYCGVPDGKIWQAETANRGDGDDGTTPTECALQSAAQLLSQGVGKVRTATVSPLLQGSTNLNFEVELVPDYGESTYAYTPNNMIPGTSPGSVQFTVASPMVTYTIMANAVAVAISFSTTNYVEVLGFRVTYEVGSIV